MTQAFFEASPSACGGAGNTSQAAYRASSGERSPAYSDGAVTAHLIALACAETPEGQVK